MSRQLNLKLNDELADLLDAAVFVQELRSPQALVMPEIEALAKRLRGDPDVIEALDVLRKRRAREPKSSVRPIRR